MDANVARVKDTHESSLRQMANVVGVGVGFKVKGGVRTSQEAVIVFVRKKQPLALIPAGAIIPQDLNGVATDVVETIDEVVALTTTLAVEPHRQRHRPVVGGVSCGPSNMGWAGTLGLPLVYRDSVAGLLSNRHVISPSWANGPGFVWKGQRVRQPSFIDGGKEEDSVAEVQDLVAIVPGQDNEVDADFAAYSPGSSGLAVLAELYELGRYEALAEPEAGMEVSKSGRTSGVTKAAILSIHTSISITYPVMGPVQFVDQIVTEPLLSPGDSGSVLYHESTRSLVGLGFAGSSAISLANPMKKVFQKLGLSLTPTGRTAIMVAFGDLIKMGALLSAWAYDAARQAWVLFDPARPTVSDLEFLERGHGYWINVTQEGVLTFQSGSTQLSRGWNLIGWPPPGP